MLPAPPWRMRRGGIGGLGDEGTGSLGSIFELGDGRVRFEMVEMDKVIEVNDEKEESWT
jgi:hypothetical protein